jgi:hypothetical protein
MKCDSSLHEKWKQIVNVSKWLKNGLNSNEIKFKEYEKEVVKILNKFKNNSPANSRDYLQNEQLQQIVCDNFNSTLDVVDEITQKFINYSRKSPHDESFKFNVPLLVIVCIISVIVIVCAGFYVKRHYEKKRERMKVQNALVGIIKYENKSCDDFYMKASTTQIYFENYQTDVK